MMFHVTEQNQNILSHPHYFVPYSSALYIQKAGMCDASSFRVEMALYKLTERASL